MTNGSLFFDSPILDCLYSCPERHWELDAQVRPSSNPFGHWGHCLCLFRSDFIGLFLVAIYEVKLSHYPTYGFPQLSYSDSQWPAPNKFYKGRSQEKTHLLRPELFLLLSPLDRARSVLTYRAMCSVAGPCGPVNWVLSISGFHRFFATKPVSSETNKAERWSNLATIVLLGTRGP
jgi:hypothetical protein